jgi:hypothetical protein
MNRGPNEKGKAGQDNEQPPEDQDPHACNIHRSLPPFKVPSTGRPSTNKDPACHPFRTFQNPPSPPLWCR